MDGRLDVSFTRCHDASDEADRASKARLFEQTDVDPGCEDQRKCSPYPALRATTELSAMGGGFPVRGKGLIAGHHAICVEAKSQFTTFQNASMYFGRALR